MEAHLTKLEVRAEGLPEFSFNMVEFVPMKAPIMKITVGTFHELTRVALPEEFEKAAKPHASSSACQLPVGFHVKEIGHLLK